MRIRQSPQRRLSKPIRYCPKTSPKKIKKSCQLTFAKKAQILFREWIDKMKGHREKLSQKSFWYIATIENYWSFQKITKDGARMNKKQTDTFYETTSRTWSLEEYKAIIQALESNGCKKLKTRSEYTLFKELFTEKGKRGRALINGLIFLEV